MHAFILATHNSDTTKEVVKLAKNLKAKTMPFTLAKVDDVRELNSFVRLTITEPTLIVIENIHLATTEALNAFLKNLEEPQENIYFALTTPSVKQVLPTIVSRCQIIKIAENPLNEVKANENSKAFLELSTGEKLAYVDKIKDRAKAVEFTNSLVQTLHTQIHTANNDYKDVVNNATECIKAWNNLKANGNIGLQLANLSINLAHTVA